MKRIIEILKMMATAAAVAIVVFSCKSKLDQAEALNLEDTPLQVVDSMYMIDSKNGQIQMRILTGRMEKYEKDTLRYELFPQGISVFAYKEDGILESTIEAEEARHETYTNGEEEIWKAYGHVVVRNIEKRQTMETDTLYWDRSKQEIYTDCYVRMYSPDGFMQGYGMRSDERARNSIIMRPFNSYTVVVQDTTVILVDSANFIGPLLKKK
ncbi:MAG: LPS export ABC transporter periplasmic protein LptC [Bacteroidales bacterium]|nr:LPS export ABC transporter periplasmic protein LptC [Bacteroidales bacterium]